MPRKELRFTDPNVATDVTFMFKGLKGNKMIAVVEKGFHYTLMPGYSWGEVDLHRTNEQLPADHPDKHERLGAMPRDTFRGILAGIGPHLMAEFVRLWRPIRLDRLIREGLIIGGRVPTDGELGEVEKICLRRGASQLPPQLADSIRAPECYEDVLVPPFYVRFLYKPHSRAPFAVMFTHLGRSGKARIKWARIQDLLCWTGKWQQILREHYELLAS